MSTVAGSYECWYSVPLNVTYLIAYLVARVHLAGRHIPEMIMEQRWARALYFLVVLHPILLAILKYRAAYHRKIRKRQKLNNGRLQFYLKELFLCEAKVTPIRHPFFPEIWHSFCYVAAWILFPRPVVLVYVLNFGFPSIFVHLITMGCQSDLFNNASKFVYNGRCYRHALVGTYYFGFEDENKNILYYPTLDRCGLIPSDNESAQGAC